MLRCSAELGKFNLNPQSLQGVKIRRQLLGRGCRQERYGVQQAPLDVGSGELSELVAQLEVVGFDRRHEIEPDRSAVTGEIRLRFPPPSPTRRLPGRLSPHHCNEPLRIDGFDQVLFAAGVVGSVPGADVP